MYSILADGELLWRSDYEGFEVFNPVWDTELNKAGSLRFTLPPYHPYYSKLQKLKTTIDLYNGGELIWRGRVLSDDGIDFGGKKTVYCEGALSFFVDSVVRPYEWKSSVSDYFTFLISQHNEQVEKNRQFRVGRCTVTDPNNLIVRANRTYPDTLSEMEDKLLGLLGGYLTVTFEDGELVLNYLKDSGDVSEQVVTFGDNLVDLTQYIDASDVYTVIVPVGATYEVETSVTSSSQSTSGSSDQGTSGGSSQGSPGGSTSLTREDIVDALGYTPLEEITGEDVIDALGYTPPTQDTNTTYSAGSNITLNGTTFSLTRENVTGALGYTPASSVTAEVGFDDWVDNSAAFTQGNIRAAKIGGSNNSLCVVGTTSGGVKFDTALSTGFNQVSTLPSGFRPPLNWTGTAIYGTEVVGCIVWADGSVGFWLSQSHSVNDTLHFNIVFPVYEEED